MNITREKFFELRNSIDNIEELAKKLNTTVEELTQWSKVKGWSLKKRPKISNTKFFHDYNEYSCYWGGFLAADGNVDQKGRIRLTLKHDDINHLEKFKSCLGSNHTIGENTTKYNRCSFEFTHIEMCEDLKYNFNIIPNKTFKYEMPSSIPSNMLRHYIRGYFDGDGSICESFSNKNSRTATLYATVSSGSEDFSRKLFTFFQDRLKLGGQLQEFSDSIKFQIKFNTNDARKLLNYMYEDSNIYLDRKYLLYERIVLDNIRQKR